MRRIIYQAAKAISLTLLAVQLAVTAVLLAGNLTQHQVMIVTGGSMEPTYRLGSAVLLDVSQRTPAVGDVVTFFTANHVITTHRVISLHDIHGETYLRTQGDANPGPDHDLVAAKDVVGMPGMGVPWAGYAITWLTSPVGKLLTFGPVLAMIAGREILVLTGYRRSEGRGRRRATAEVPA